MHAVEARGSAAPPSTEELVIHYSYQGEHRTHGGPQVAAACFAVLIPAVLLLPLVRVAYDGEGAGNITLFLLRAGGGFNIFALLLLLIPLVGIGVAMMQRPSWDIAALVIAAIGAIMVPLAILTVSHGVHDRLGNVAAVTPGMGAYALFAGFATLALASGIEAWRARRHHADDRAHAHLGAPARRV
jgi:hypothetical protein